MRLTRPLGMNKNLKFLNHFSQILSKFSNETRAKVWLTVCSRYCRRTSRPFVLIDFADFVSKRQNIEFKSSLILLSQIYCHRQRHLILMVSLTEFNSYWSSLLIFLGFMSQRWENFHRNFRFAVVSYGVAEPIFKNAVGVVVVESIRIENQ